MTTYILSIIGTVVFTVIMCGAAWNIPAQEANDIAACMPEIANGRLVMGGYHIAWLDDLDWDGLHRLSGEYVFDDENYQWLLPDNLVIVFRVIGDNAETSEPIRIDIAPGDNVWYWFLYDNLQPFTDDDGNHYGVHPCGAYAVNWEDTALWIRQTWLN